MTNTTSSNPEVKKKRKFPGGPIRWKGFIPIALVIGGTVFYFTVLFDGHLKRLLEWAGTKGNGAKVDIASLKTSFIRSDFDLRGLEVTSQSDPMKNLVAVDRIHFQFLLAQLFKKKLVIRDMSVAGIQYGTARKRSGAVPGAAKAEGPGFFDKISAAMNASLKSIIDQTPLASLEGLFTGGNLAGKAQKLGEDSASFKKIKEVEGQINSSVTQWQKSVSELPNEGTVKGFQSRVEALVNQKPNNPEEFVRNIQQVQGIKGEIEAQFTKVKTLQQTVTTQVQTVATNVASIDKAVDQDIQGIRNQLKIPSLNFKDITPHLLGDKLTRYIQQAAYWAAMSRKYMPKKKPGEVVVKQERQKGVDIHFGGVQVFPKFLLEHAGISSNVSTDPTNGNVSGDLTGITNDPHLYGKPAKLLVKGDFPSARIQGGELGIVVDHTGEIDKEAFTVGVSAFPVEEWNISDSGPFQIGINKAIGRAKMEILFGENDMKATLAATLAGVEYRSGSTTPQIATLLEKILKGLPTFGIRGTVQGNIDNLKVDLASDLGEKIASGIQNEFKAQIAALNDQIRKQVQEQIDAKKRELTARFEAEKKKVMEPVEQRLKQLQDVTKLADSAKERIEREKDNFIKAKASEGVDQLKKAIKLPGF